MVGWNPKANELFLLAIEMSEPDTREAYLDAACAGNAELRAEVEGLLQAHEGAGSFLDSPAADPQRTFAWLSVAEQPGATIGRYKLLEQIGEGGFGVVFMAEQTEPVERRVALKIIKPGMDTRQVIGRFEAERRALAMMDHPNIAKVFEAGTTDTGRPYFVMELVKGSLITEYCDEHHLTPRERLELFMPVCQAVQHAHQKGVIHRDIKPTNVMVAEYDDRPVPKIIDFGVAKAIDQRLTERTLFTQIGQVVGTVEYMSPEQAKLNQLDIDTRSDIYSLGVLLYELLTGETPFDRQRLRSAAFDEVLRIIREEEPPKPSLRLSSSESLPSIAASRQTEPKKLSALVRGELDWIVMKALEKDRARRYQSASDLARDIERHFRDEPIEARPQSTGYRLRKYTRRYKVQILTATVIIVTLCGGILGTTIGLIRATRAEAEARHDATRARNSEQLAEERFQLARQAADEAKANAQLAQRSAEQAEAERQRAEANFREAREAVDRMLTRVASRDLENVPQMTLVRKALLQDSLEFYQRFLQESGTDPEVRLETALAWQRVGHLHAKLGQNTESKQALEESIAQLERLRAEYPANPSVRSALAVSYGRFGEMWLWSFAVRDNLAAEQFARKALKLHEELAAEFPDDPKGLEMLAGARRMLGQVLAQAGRLEEAEELFREALTDFTSWSSKNPADSNADYGRAVQLLHLGDLLTRTKRQEEAEELYRQSLRALERLVAQDRTGNNGDRLFHLCGAQSRLARLLSWTGHPWEAERLFQHAISTATGRVSDFPRITNSWTERGWCYSSFADFLVSEGRLPEAEVAYGKALADFEEPVGSAPDVVLYVGRQDVQNALVDLQVRAGRMEAAEQVCRRTIALFEKVAPELLAGEDYLQAPTSPDGQLNLSKDLRYSQGVEAHQKDRRFSLGRRSVHQAYWVHRAEAHRSLADVLMQGGRDDEGLAEYLKAVEAFMQAIELRPRDYRPHYELALVHLARRDLEAFRKVCSTMLERLGEIKEPLVAALAAWTCALGPAAVADLARPVALAETAVQADPQNSDYLKTLGASLYRAGRFEEAIQRLAEADRLVEQPSPTSQSSPAYTWYFLSMAHHRVGQADDASKSLQKAVQWTDKVLSEQGKGGGAKLPWNRRLTLQILRQEAEKLVAVENQKSARQEPPPPAVAPKPPTDNN